MESKVKEIFGNRIVLGLIPGLYDKVTRTSPDTVTDDWEYFFRTVSIGTVRVIYASAAKTEISTIERIA
jgi:hypothetical protein